MSKATLYDLVIGERGALSELLEETDGELTPELEQLLTELDLKIDDKLEHLGLYVLDQQGDAAKLKEEEQRLSARRKSIERGVEGLKRYAERLMAAAGKEKVKTSRVTVWMQANPPKLVGDLDEEALTELLDVGGAANPIVRMIPARLELDRESAKRLLKSGETITGLSLEQTTSLRVR